MYQLIISFEYGGVVGINLEVNYSRLQLFEDIPLLSYGFGIR